MGTIVYDNQRASDAWIIRHRGFRSATSARVWKHNSGDASGGVGGGGSYRVV